MDEKYYVIDLTGDIDELEKDMSKWSNLPYEFRMKGNDECIRRYGITNIELYNRLKYNILYNKEPGKINIDNIGSSISEAVNYSDIHFEDTDNYILRLKMAEELNKNPLTAIILPDIQDMETLGYWYNKYLLLADTYRRFSNSYSINLFGFNVPNMYIIMKNKIEGKDTEDTDEIIPSIGSAISESSIPMMQPVLDEIDKMIIEDDKIGLLKMKILFKDPSIHPVDKALYDRFNNSIDEQVYGKNTFDSYINEEPIPKYWFTPSEIIDNNIKLESVNGSYREAVLQAMQSGDKDKVLSLGWNPEVPMNDASIAYAKGRQLKWIRENIPNIIDISKMPVSSDDRLQSIQETTKNMRNLYRMHDCYPVFIVTSFSYTGPGKMISLVKHSKFSHSGLALDSNLQNIYTYVYTKANHGFATETPKTYVNENKNSYIAVLAIFVDGKVFSEIKNYINYYIKNSDKTKYKFSSYLTMLFNVPEKTDNYSSLEMVCSQFVDSILRLANIDITNKPNSLVIPEDFYKTKNPKVYLLYDGLAKDFTEREIESKIFGLFDKHDDEELLYSNFVREMSNLTLNSRYHITDNPEADKIVQEINELLTPEPVIFERAFPIVVKNDGTISIRLMKTLEREYQEAHRLLITYNSDNLPGIKHELARLFYIEIIAEKKIEKMDKSDPKRKQLVDLRARVINDFKKYMKVVLDQESNFDFEAYFRESEYYDAVITFDKNIFKLAGDILKYIFTFKH